MIGGKNRYKSLEMQLFALFCLMIFGVIALAYIVVVFAAGVWVVVGLTGIVLLTSLATYILVRTHLDPLTKVVEDSEVMKREFISIVSHQLRTPLTSIRLFSEMLESELPLEEREPREFVRNIRLSSEKMVHLVSELLNLSRIEGGRLTVDPKPTDLASFMHDLVVELEPLATLRQCKLVFKTPRHRLPLIPLDHDLLHHVLSNILENAVKYSGRDENTVTITLDRFLDEDRPFVRISIKDEGIGIPKEDQPHVYEKFFRGSNATHVLTEGTGLGLYLTKVILDSSGGRVSFKSKEGKGTTFQVAFPLDGMHFTQPL